MMTEAEIAWKTATPQERLEAMQRAGFIGDNAYRMAVKPWTALPSIVRVQLELKVQARFDN
jgi:hypothetical protein